MGSQYNPVHAENTLRGRLCSRCYRVSVAVSATGQQEDTDMKATIIGIAIGLGVALSGAAAAAIPAAASAAPAASAPGIYYESAAPAIYYES